MKNVNFIIEQKTLIGEFINAESKNNLLRCSKAYKKVLNTQHNLYHKGFY